MRFSCIAGAHPGHQFRAGAMEGAHEATTDCGYVVRPPHIAAHRGCRAALCAPRAESATAATVDYAGRRNHILAFSTTTAIPCPLPMHIVTSP